MAGGVKLKYDAPWKGLAASLPFHRLLLGPLGFLFFLLSFGRLLFDFLLGVLALAHDVFPFNENLIRPYVIAEMQYLR